MKLCKYIWPLFLFFYLIGGAKTGSASTTTIGGTIRDAQGNLFNGRITFTLPVSATDTGTGAAIAPTAVSYPVRNGIFPPNATLEDTTTLAPGNLYYTAYRYDAAGMLVSIENYSPVTGNPWNIGLAIPVAVTTSNITFLTPASLSAMQTWTALQNFSSGISVGGGSTIAKVLYTSAALTFTAISAQTCQEQTVTTTSGSAAIAFANPGNNLGNVNLSWSARVSGANAVVVRICNPSSGSITPTAVSWNVVTMQ